jgi:D-3-phosphoglycerate dehydrogenase
VALEAAQLVIDFLQRGVIGYAVNMAAVDRTELEELRLYVDMARRLGLLHAQMDRGALRRATLMYRGEVARRNTRLITAAFTTGLLETRLDEAVNIVNAELFARERGIEVAEQIHPKKGDFSTLIRAEVTTDRKTYTAAATLFGNRLLRLVQLGPYLLDTFMEGIMLVFSHQDVPGLIGYIGTVFGKHQVNIAHMTVGRQVPGGEAVTGLSLSSPSPTRAAGEDSNLVYQIAVLNLDSPPSEEAVTEIQNHPKIKSVSIVKLPPAGEMPVWFG